MNTFSETPLLRLIWQESLFPAGGLRTVTGEAVEVRGRGELDETTGDFTGAEVVVGGVVCRGDVLVHDPEAGVRNARFSGRHDSERAVMQIASSPCGLLCRPGGDPLPQLVVPVSEALREKYRQLVSGAGKTACGEEIAGLDDFKRVTLMTRLQFERIHRKCEELMHYHLESEESWSETLYVMLFRAMGDDRNKNAFVRLARAVPYSVVSHERGEMRLVEALLLGGSGLLETRDDDEYVLTLKRDFEYLRRKYSITPLRPIAWNLSRIQPYNSPVLRIVQLAAFLTSRDFVFDNLIACRTPEDVQRLFSAEASGYWETHFTLSRSTAVTPKRIGTDKANSMGINLVAPLMIAYANCMGDERLRDGAITLLESIPCEKNRVIGQWREKGVVMENAFDSQAMLQLTREYCERSRCAECGLGRHLIKKGYMP